MDAPVRCTPVERIARGNDADDVSAAYVAGYADAVALLRPDEHDHAPAEPLGRIHARYLCYAELQQPTPEARAYVAGFRDAAADNLPCPPHEIEPETRRVAA
jgi:hypothetical protein